MADTREGMPPEGWYPDRPNATRLRHWTGTTWTNEFRESSVPAVAPVASTLVADEPVEETTGARTRRELRERSGPLTVGEPDEQAVDAVAAERGLPPLGSPRAEPARHEHPAPESARHEHPPVEAQGETPRDEPVPIPRAGAAASLPISSVDKARAAGGFTSPRQAPEVQQGPAGPSHTFPGWLFALAPLWAGLLIVVALAATTGTNPALVLGGLGLVALGLSWLLARLDAQRLRDRGYRAPSLWWVLLPLGYLIVRTIRVGGKGATLIVGYVLAAVALVALVAVGMTVSPALQVALTPPVPAASTPLPTAVATLTASDRATLLTKAGTEAQLRKDLAKTWTVGSVECVPFSPTTAGSTTTCVVVLDDVSYTAGLQVTPDEPDTAFVLTGMLPVKG